MAFPCKRKTPLPPGSQTDRAIPVADDGGCKRFGKPLWRAEGGQGRLIPAAQSTAQHANPKIALTVQEHGMNRVVGKAVGARPVAEPVRRQAAYAVAAGTNPEVAVIRKQRDHGAVRSRNNLVVQGAMVAVEPQYTLKRAHPNLALWIAINGGGPA